MLTSQVIEGFVGSCLVKNFDGSLSIPDIHREWWDLCCSKEKFVAIAAPRGHAKSTAITFSYVLASVLFRERSYVLIVSDTETQACLFLGSIKQELQQNEDIIKLFGLKKNVKGEVVFLKDSESDIIVELDDGYQFRIMAKGSEQKLRGLLWNGKRPDLLVLDDLENDEIVMNKERREKFRRWFFGALLPARSQNGIVRYVGTVLHMDSMLERTMPKDHDKQTVFDGLKIYSLRNSMWKAVKYMGHNEDFSQILWKEKVSKEDFIKLREYYIEMGLPDVYSQEYLNKPIDESVSYFKRADFLPMNEEDQKKKVNYYVTADLAISEKERSDFTAIAIGGVDENNFLFIKNMIRDRMDGRTIVDTLIQIQKIYNPEVIGIEEGQITKAIGPFLREEMIKENTFLNILPLKPHRTDKIMRARSVQARMRAGAVKFDKRGEWYASLEDECLKFPRSRHDDQVDALAYMGLMIDKYIPALTKEEEQDEEYEEDLKKSGYYFQGINNTTGY